MPRSLRFKRLCPDTNIIIALALLYEKGERVFINTNIAGDSTLFRVKQYALDIQNLQKYIDNNKIELIITPQVMHELQFRKATIDENGNKVELDQETILQEKLKDIALEYIPKMPQIKVARILPDRRWNYKEFTEKLADEYVFQHIFAKNKNGNTPSDAIIVAQATGLHIDFITRDRHFLKQHVMSSVTNAEKIHLTNKTFGNHPTKVIPFEDLDNIMSKKTDFGVKTKDNFKQNTPICPCAYMPFDEYLEDKKLELENLVAWMNKHLDKSKEL